MLWQVGRGDPLFQLGDLITLISAGGCGPSVATPTWPNDTEACWYPLPSSRTAQEKDCIVAMATVAWNGGVLTLVARVGSRAELEAFCSSFIVCESQTQESTSNTHSLSLRHRRLETGNETGLQLYMYVVPQYYTVEAHFALLTAICLSSSGCTALNRSERSTVSRTSSFSWKEPRRMEVKRSGRLWSGRESRRRCVEGEGCHTTVT